MVNKADQARITALLTEAITVLCKNGLAYQAEFSIEGLLGITLDKQDIFLINIKETVQRELHRKAKQDGKGDSQDSDDVEMSADYGSDSEHLTFSSTLEGMMGSLADSKRKRRWSQPENGSAKEDGGKELRNDHHRSRVKEESDSGDESAYDRVPHPHSQRETSLAPGSTTLVGTEGPSATPQLLSGEVMPGGATWDQTLGSSNLTMSQAAVVSTPLLAASMSQMTGIAQPTQVMSTQNCKCLQVNETVNVSGSAFTSIWNAKNVTNVSLPVSLYLLKLFCHNAKCLSNCWTS